LNRVESIQRQR